MSSFVQYPGDGSTKIFSVPFPYLDKAHVRITIGGVLKETGISWNTEASVELNAAPANDAVVDIRRVTPVNVPIVDFTDGSVLTERNLDTLARWLQYVSEENRDNSMQVNTLGQWEGGSRRIQNVQDPIDAQDVVTKKYMETVGLDGIEIPELPALSTFPMLIASGRSTTSEAPRIVLPMVDPGAGATKYVEATTNLRAVSTTFVPWVAQRSGTVTDLALGMLIGGIAAGQAIRVMLYAGGPTGLPGTLVGSAEIHPAHSVGQLTGGGYEMFKVPLEWGVVGGTLYWVGFSPSSNIGGVRAYNGSLLHVLGYNFNTPNAADLLMPPYRCPIIRTSRWNHASPPPSVIAPWVISQTLDLLTNGDIPAQTATPPQDPPTFTMGFTPATADVPA